MKGKRTEQSSQDKVAFQARERQLFLRAQALESVQSSYILGRMGSPAWARGISSSEIMDFYLLTRNIESTTSTTHAGVSHNSPAAAGNAGEWVDVPTPLSPFTVKMTQRSTRAKHGGSSDSSVVLCLPSNFSSG